MCKKHGHKHQLEAQRQAFSLMKKGADYVRVYECQCGRYHVTKMTIQEYFKTKIK